MKTTRGTLRFGLLSVLVVQAVAIVALCFPAHTAFAAADATSRWPAAGQAYAMGNPTYDSVASGFTNFRSASSGFTRINRLAAYYTDNSPKQITFNPNCNSNVPNNIDVSVTLNGVKTTYSNKAASCAERTFTVTPVWDPTTTRYRVSIVIAIETTSTRSDNTRFTFIVETPAPGKVSNVRDMGEGTNTAVLGRPGPNYSPNGNNSYHFAMIYPFAVACNETAWAGTQWKNIAVYDADNWANGGNRNISFSVWEKVPGGSWQKIPRTSYRNIVNGTYSTSLTDIVPSEAASNGKSTTAQFQMRSDSKYQLRVYNIFVTGADNGSASNYVASGIPYDSILGSENFTCSPTASPYELTPNVDVNPDVAEVGSTINMTGSVTNNGSVASSPANWEVRRVVIPVNSTVPAATSGSTANPTAYFGGTLVTSGTGTVFSSGTRNLWSDVETLGNFAAGDRVCFTLSVSPHNTTSSTWSHAIDCVTIAKKPKVQVLGSDLIVGRGTAYNAKGLSDVVTSTTYVSGAPNRYYGSWSEYAIIASGTVQKMASGALYVGGSTVGDLCSLSILTISNNNGTGCVEAEIGNYDMNSTAPNIASRFQVNQNIATPNVDIRDLASGGVYSITNATLGVTSSQPIGLNGATGRGKWVVIKDTDSDVTINSNIQYADTTPFTGIDDIPQVIIIAKNISIAPNVTRVDAWLITTGQGDEGYINTCNSVPAGDPTSATLNASTCTEQLIINGPVMANKLYLYRTAPSGTGSNQGVPAEIFNLRADAYLWASFYNQGIGRLPTVSTQELPPKY